MIAWEAERPFAPPAVGSVDADDGVALLYRLWDVDEPHGRVCIVHGLGEHGGRYTVLAEALLQRRIATVAPDLRGHGVSGGRRGHVRRFDEYLSDLERIVGETVRDAPTILFGHSLGGLVALRAAQEGRAGRLAGLVLSAPALELSLPEPVWQRPAAAVLSRIAPTLALPNGIDPADLSHDERAVEAYRTDPLVHDRITPRLYTEMRRAMSAAAMQAERVGLPVLLLAPGDDRVTRVSTAVATAARFRGPVTVREYPGFYHEPLHEQDGSIVLAHVLAWIESLLS